MLSGDQQTVNFALDRCMLNLCFSFKIWHVWVEFDDDQVEGDDDDDSDNEYIKTIHVLLMATR